MRDYGCSLAVFAGPSLPPEDRLALDAVTYLPPASRGDVERAANEYDVVLLIDGVFHHDLAPSPKECYAALQHARMFGASSMGALRAAECAPYGFTPLGAIANWYVRDLIDGDDEVAVLTHPERHEALSVPLVNVRHVARLAHRRGILNASERAALIERARDVFYMDRAWEDVLDVAPHGARADLAELIARDGDLKRLDARFALRRALRARERGERAVTERPSPTAVWAAHHAPRATAPLVLPASVPKSPGTYDRAVPFARTIALLPTLRERYGITRVADTTYLDRTSIPTFSAMVPHSPDLLGVYNGKGMTREGAMASAVMEATERQLGAAVHLPVFKEAMQIVGERIDLDVCGVREDARELVVDCVLGTELFSGDAIPVPLAMVQCPWFGERLFDTTTTNGLASGNNLTEAIYHALCELIERHAWAIYHVRCSVAPRFFGGAKAKDLPLAPEIELPAGEANVDHLVREIRRAGLTVRAMLLDEPPLPVTMLAAITEPDAPLPMAHMGLGCSLSPAHALTRALTEAVQSRVVDIQAAREDVLRPGERAGVMGTHGQRLTALPTDQWYYDLPASSRSLSNLPDRTSGDLAEDVRRVLDALRTYRIPSVVAVDLSPPDVPISVVRMLVPGLETFMVNNQMGPRARAELNPFAVWGA
jgi:ribosomal protein S12 methylthiotransferase accessory factor